MRDPDLDEMNADPQPCLHLNRRHDAGKECGLARGGERGLPGHQALPLDAVGEVAVGAAAGRQAAGNGQPRLLQL